MIKSFGFLLLPFLTMMPSVVAQTRQIGPAEFYWLMNRACFGGDELSVKMLLSAGANPSVGSDYDAFLEKYRIAYEPSIHLVSAARGGHLSVVRVLLEARADPNALEGEGYSAIAVAARAGHTDVVVLLLKFGADACIQTPLGTPQQLAQSRGHNEIAKLLRSVTRDKCDSAAPKPPDAVTPGMIPKSSPKVKGRRQP